MEYKTNLGMMPMKKSLILALRFVFVITLTISSVQPISVDVSKSKETVYEDESITIRCEADYVALDSTINFTWLHEENVIATGGLIAGDMTKHHVTFDGEQASILRIADINKQDTGAYTCIALDSKSSLTASASTRITVFYPPVAHFPTCFVQNAILQDLTLQEGTRLTLVCASGVSAPLPMIVWYRTDKIPPEKVSGGIIIPGESNIRSELTIVVTEEYQGAIFSCELETDAFPDLDRDCNFLSISVLTEGTESVHVNYHTLVPTVSSNEDPDHSNDRHANKESDVLTTKITTTALSDTDVSCQTRQSLADRAMIPSVVILALLLLISVVFNFLQMVRNAQINASNRKQVECIRHEALPENNYMAINAAQRTSSQYATLNMRYDKTNGYVSHYYECDMPSIKEDHNLNEKESYEDMTVGSNPELRMSVMSKVTYEEMADDSRPTSIASTSTNRQQGPNSMRPVSQTESTDYCSYDYLKDAEYVNDEIEKGHTYERTISALSGSASDA